MSETTIGKTIKQAIEVINALPECNQLSAYVFFNQATKRHGFYFAPDDDSAEQYAQRCGLAEQTNWLIVAVVPAKNA
jgi:hypothetical protein